jgi:hypothetical protein
MYTEVLLSFGPAGLTHAAAQLAICDQLHHSIHEHIIIAATHYETRLTVLD